MFLTNRVSAFLPVLTTLPLDFRVKFRDKIPIEGRLGLGCTKEWTINESQCKVLPERF